MAKIYLCEDRKDALVLRRLYTIDAFCSLIEMGRNVPDVSNKEKEAARIILNYTNKNILKTLKRCKLYAKESSREDDEETAVIKESLLLKQTIGSCCILAGEEAEVTLYELEILSKCKTIQEALKTGKNIILHD